MKNLFYLFLCFAISSFSVTAQEINPERQIDSLLAIQQPNKANQLLWKWIDQAQKDQNALALVKAARKLPEILYPLESQKRAQLFFKLWHRADRFSQPAKSLVKMECINQMTYNYYNWFSSAYIPLFDTLDLRNEFTRFQWVEQQSKYVQTQLAGLQQYPFQSFQDELLEGNDSLFVSRTVGDYVAYKLIALYQSPLVENSGNLKTAKTSKKNWYGSTYTFKQLSFPTDNLTTRILRLFKTVEKNNANFLNYLSTAVYLRVHYLSRKFNKEAWINAAWKEEFAYFKNSNARSKFLYEWARTAYFEGKKYHFKTHPADEGKLKFADSLVLAEQKEFPNNSHKYALAGLHQLIHEKSVEMQLPNIVPPTQKIPVLFTYQNDTSAFLQIYKVISYQPLKDRRLRNALLKGNLELLRSIPLSFQTNGYYQTRTKEQLLEGLNEAGHYFIVLTDKKYDLPTLARNYKQWNKTAISASKLVVSEINAAFSASNGTTHAIVVNQLTGKPIKNAAVTLYTYDYGQGTNWKKKETRYTDGNGEAFFHFKEYQSVLYVVKSGNSVLSTQDYESPQQKKYTSSAVKLLTDRAVYRPGQIVYFKGIVYKGSENNYAISAKETVKVTIRDASYQDVYKQTFTTNSFGSFDGQFLLPKSLPLGRFRLYASTTKAENYLGGTDFRVEEYKRPTFEVTLQSPEKKAALNDTVSLTGKAIAFAGFPIDGAKVTYEVYRKWFNYWRFYFEDDSNGDLLETGEFQTNKAGEFTIDFFAATDPNAVRGAFYYYVIKAKVTDVSGETHAQSLSLRLNKTGLAIQLTLPNQWDVLQGEKLVAPTVVNLAGKIQPNHTGNIEILKMPAISHFINRMWKNAQYSSISATDLNAIFPYMQTDTYAKAAAPVLVKSFPFHSGDSLDFTAWFSGQQGRFLVRTSVVLSTGDTLHIEQPVEIIDAVASELPFAQALWLYTPKTTTKVGEEIHFQVGSSFENATALVSLINGDGKVLHQWTKLKKRVTFTHTVTEADRGNLKIHVALLHHGKWFTKEVYIYVPFDNKKLVIKTSTFRDKLKPGTKEEWKFTVQNSSGKWAEAELAATLYDASLDAIYAHNWGINLYHSWYGRQDWDAAWDRSNTQMSLYGYHYLPWLNNFRDGVSIYHKVINNLFRRYRYQNTYGGVMHFNRVEKAVMSSPAFSMKSKKQESGMLDEIDLENKFASDSVSSAETIYPERPGDKTTQTMEQTRSNFSETAFFYPMIYADSAHKYTLQFTLPESLTKWKLLLLAHTADMKVGSLQKQITAQKEVMITANAPRFVRQGDHFLFAAKVVNLTDTMQEITVQLALENPFDGASLKQMLDSEATKTIKVPAHTTSEVAWPLSIGDVSLIAYTVTAANDAYSDGERNLLPVLSNRTLVTETQHKILRDTGKTTLEFSRFINGQTPTLENVSYTVEYVDNLAWNAVLALPYLSRQENQSTTALMNSYYANAVAAKILNDHPKIKTIFAQWKDATPDVLWSELQKNEQLKSILLKETPWVMEAKDEAEQRRRIALLFQLNQVQDNQRSLLNQLEKRQNADGGFAWFDGGRSSVFITQKILMRWAQLKQLDIPITEDVAMLKHAVGYLENQQVKAYRDAKANDWKLQVGTSDVQWLYIRSFFPFSSSEEVNEIVSIYTKQLAKDWTDFSPYLQAMIGIYGQLNNKKELAGKIYASLVDRAHNNQLGMYWVENSGYNWYSNKIGTQAMIISFFHRMDKTQKALEDARLWLILNKETNQWETSAETADAVFAVLSTGKNYLATTEAPQITVGKYHLTTEKSEGANDVQVEWTPGIGQMKKGWSGKEITKDMGTIEVTKSTATPAAVSIFWQYTEELGQVKASQNQSMYIHKRYLRMTAGEKDEVGEETTHFTRGDKIKVELTIYVDRDMDFVHIKDLRPAGFAPVATTSGYHWENGLTFYQSPKDAGMHYFIEHLSRGTYKLSYFVYATHSGDFNSGWANIQSFYAPAFAAHSATKEVYVER